MGNEAEFVHLSIDSYSALVSQLGVLQGLTQGINVRLDTLNGTVEKTLSELNLTKVELALHPVNCPIKATLEELRQSLATGAYPGSKAVLENLEKFNLAEVARRASEKTKAKVTNTFLEWIKPFAIPFAYLLLFLLGMHFYEIWHK